jgi:DNA-binding CsgD family transcriptional regulator
METAGGSLRVRGCAGLQIMIEYPEERRCLSMTIAYGILTVIAVLLLINYCCMVKKDNIWLRMLFACVCVVNLGYFLLSMAKSLNFAIFANDLTYLGSVFLSLCMFMTILDLCGISYSRKLPVILLTLGMVMFAIVCTSGILPWYYREVTLVHVEGAAKLKKVYGVLHPVYLVYLLGYFAAMIVAIVRSRQRTSRLSHKHAILMTGIVLGNISVWVLEKFVPWDFEFLSVSYLFSEIVLLGLYWMMQDYVRVDMVPQPAQETLRTAPVDIATMPMEEKILKILSFLKPGEILATREREILERILMNKRRKEIADELCLSENTIKTYTRTLYGKLGVS